MGDSKGDVSSFSGVAEKPRWSGKGAGFMRFLCKNFASLIGLLFSTLFMLDVVTLEAGGVSCRFGMMSG